jgi:hypothetical protein
MVPVGTQHKGLHRRSKKFLTGTGNVKLTLKLAIIYEPASSRLLEKMLIDIL